MLKKLLKYDLRAIFKYWWIVALSSVGLSCVGGIALKIMLSYVEKTMISDTDTWIFILSIIGIFVSFIGMCAFLIASEIFIYVRLYQNLFSDEGYLTFTLPVKRRDILNAKLFSGMIMNSATVLLFALEVAAVFFIGVDGKTVNKILDAVFFFIGEAFKELGLICIAYILECIVILISISALSYLMIAFCITFASVVAKKYKIFVAIGIYYLANAVISFGAQFSMMFGSISIAGIFGAIPDGSITGITALILLSISLLSAALAVALYIADLYLIDKKLNLS